MKRFIRIFELSRNEQRVVLLVMLVLVAISLVGYERRVRTHPAKLTAAISSEPSPTPVETQDEQ